MLFALVMIVFTIPYLALQPMAAGYALEALFGLPYFYGCLLVTGIILLYTLRGGTTVVDFLQRLPLGSWGEHRRIHHCRLDSFFLGCESAGNKKGRSFLLGTSESGIEAQDAPDEMDLAGLAGSESAILEVMASDSARVKIIDPTDFPESPYTVNSAEFVREYLDAYCEHREMDWDELSRCLILNAAGACHWANVSDQPDAYSTRLFEHVTANFAEFGSDALLVPPGTD